MPKGNLKKKSKRNSKRNSKKNSKKSNKHRVSNTSAYENWFKL